MADIEWDSFEEQARELSAVVPRVPGRLRDLVGAVASLDIPREKYDLYDKLAANDWLWPSHKTIRFSEGAGFLWWLALHKQTIFQIRFSPEQKMWRLGPEIVPGNVPIRTFVRLSKETWYEEKTSVVAPWLSALPHMDVFDVFWNILEQTDIPAEAKCGDAASFFRGRCKNGNSWVYEMLTRPGIARDGDLVCPPPGDVDAFFIFRNVLRTRLRLFGINYDSERDTSLHVFKKTGMYYPVSRDLNAPVRFTPLVRPSAALINILKECMTGPYPSFVRKVLLILRSEHPEICSIPSESPDRKTLLLALPEFDTFRLSEILDNEALFFQFMLLSYARLSKAFTFLGNITLNLGSDPLIPQKARERVQQGLLMNSGTCVWTLTFYHHERGEEYHLGILIAKSNTLFLVDWTHSFAAENLLRRELEPTYQLQNITQPTPAIQLSSYSGLAFALSQVLTADKDQSFLEGSKVGWDAKISEDIDAELRGVAHNWLRSFRVRVTEELRVLRDLVVPQTDTEIHELRQEEDLKERPDEAEITRALDLALPERKTEEKKRISTKQLLREHLTEVIHGYTPRLVNKFMRMLEQEHKTAICFSAKTISNLQLTNVEQRKLDIRKNGLTHIVLPVLLVNDHWVLIYAKVEQNVRKREGAMDVDWELRDCNVTDRSEEASLAIRRFVESFVLPKAWSGNELRVCDVCDQTDDNTFSGLFICKWAFMLITGTTPSLAWSEFIYEMMLHPRRAVEHDLDTKHND